MITVSDLSLNYDGTPLFSHVDLQFVRGIFAAYGINVIPIETEDRGDGTYEEIKQPASS